MFCNAWTTTDNQRFIFPWGGGKSYSGMHACVRVCCVEKKKMKHGIMKMPCHWEKMFSPITCQMWVTFGSGRNYSVFARQLCIEMHAHSTNQVMGLKINTTNNKRSDDGISRFHKHQEQVYMRSLKEKTIFFFFLSTPGGI